MRKKLMTWEKMQEKLKVSDPNIEVTPKEAKRLCKIYIALENLEFYYKANGLYITTKNPTSELKLLFRV